MKVVRVAPSFSSRTTGSYFNLAQHSILSSCFSLSPPPPILSSLTVASRGVIQVLLLNVIWEPTAPNISLSIKLLAHSSDFLRPWDLTRVSNFMWPRTVLISPKLLNISNLSQWLKHLSSTQLLSSPCTQSKPSHCPDNSTFLFQNTLYLPTPSDLHPSQVPSFPVGSARAFLAGCAPHGPPPIQSPCSMYS